MMRADLLRGALIAEAVHIKNMENLPEGWKLAGLGDVCRLINGRAFTLYFTGRSFYLRGQLLYVYISETAERLCLISIYTKWRQIPARL